MLTSIQDLNRRCNLDDSFDPLDMSGGASQPPAASTKHEKKKTQGQPAAKYLLQKRKAAKTVPEPGEKVTVRSNVAKTLKKLLVIVVFIVVFFCFWGPVVGLPGNYDRSWMQCQARRGKCLPLSA